ncbi:MAG: ATPase domain-containing protein [ANME-2 cluster archaeon]|nr:ATPase domain-containing protein [ANME-2 cluster archaeon]
MGSLDTKLSGGYPKGKGILITGVPGSGKTILGLHSINNCCIEGKKCIIIATEESPADILYQADILGLDLASYYDSGQLIIERILEKRMYSVDQLSKLGYGYDVSEINILDIPAMVPADTQLVVIDNLGVFVLDMSVKEFRGQFDAINHLLSEKGCTTLFIMDMAAYEMTNHIADYSVYGAIRLLVKENPYTSNMERYLSIPKMRSTEISLELSNFTITSKGIVLGKSNDESKT